MPDSSIHVVVRHEDDAFWATVEEFPGVFATGDNLEELRASLEEGISLWRAEAGEPAEPVQISPIRMPPTETPASADLLPA